MKKIMLLCAALLALGFMGCSGVKSSSAKQKLPKKAVEYLERLGLKDDVTAYSYVKKMRWNHPIYAMGFDNPDKCWLVETNDSTMICFTPQGDWVYTVVTSTYGDLSTKYLSEVDNLNTVLVTCKNIAGKDIHIVGVSKKKSQWVIAAYKTHDIYMGPPRYYLFDNENYKGSIIIV